MTKSLGEAMRAPIPLWLGVWLLALGAFLGAWQQAQARAEHDGANLSWASHAIFLAPIILLLSSAYIASLVPTWRKALGLHRGAS